MIKTTLYLVLSSFLLILASCSTNNKSEVGSEKVYQDYKTFVTQVEQDTVFSEANLGGSWDTRTDSLNRLAETHKSRVAAHSGEYEAERREEVNAFNERLKVAFEERQKKYDAVSHRYTLRKEVLGMEVAEDDMSRITAENIATTYAHFITTLQNNKENYSPGDWGLIEGWWSALENRRQAVSTALTPEDQESIAKYKRTYLELREQVTAQNTTASVDQTPA